MNGPLAGGYLLSLRRPLSGGFNERRRDTEDKSHKFASKYEKIAVRHRTDGEKEDFLICA